MGARKRQRCLAGPLRHILTIVIVLAAIGLVTWANYLTQVNVTGRMSGKDFMSLWTGGKAIVLDVNPYDVEVWRPLRRAYGSDWMPDPISPWPLWTHLFFVPLSFLNVQIAGAVWMTICEIALIGGVSLIVHTLGWESRWAFPLLTIGAFLFRPVFPAIVNGQVAPVLFLLLTASYALYERDRPFLAGLVLSGQILKPNLTAVLLVAVGFVFLVRRNWPALAGMATGGGLLLAVTWLIRPNWPAHWLSILGTEKGEIAHRTPTVWGLAYQWGGARLWPVSGVVAALLVSAGVVFVLWRNRDGNWVLGLCVSVIATAFLAPYLWSYEQVVILFPTSVALYWGVRARRLHPGVWWAGWFLVTTVTSWLLFIVAHHGGTDVWSAFLPMVALAYLLLAWRWLQAAERDGERLARTPAPDQSRSID